MSSNQRGHFYKLSEKFVENSVALITAFIFSVAFIGGGSFVLLEAQNELNKLDDYATIFQKGSIEAQSLNEMSDTFTKGWLSDSANLDRISETIRTLSQYKKEGILDKDYADDTFNWCVEALTTLSGEKGFVEGYTFENEIFKTHQENLSLLYSSYIDVIDELLEMVVNWEKETPDIRDAHLRNIELAAIGGRQASGALMAGESQVLAEVQLKLNEGEKIYTEAKGRFATFKTRLFLSYIGITVGLIMLLSLMFVVYQLNRKSQPVKQRANKSRKSSKKKKKK